MFSPGPVLRTLVARRAFPVLVLAGLSLSACDANLPFDPEGQTSALNKGNGKGKGKIKEAEPPPPEPDPDPAPEPDPAPAVSLQGATLWVDPNSNARKTADSWYSTRPADALQMEKVATQPTARWFSHWSGDIYSAVNKAVTTITSAGALPVLVAYNIPQRDCGGYSGGNPPSVDEYRTWIAEFARGIGSRAAVVILEPDALPAMDCLSLADREIRVQLLAEAVDRFAALPATLVYLDAGNPPWRSAATMASRLQQAGIARAAGFSLNVSNFIGDAENVSYGTAISSLVGGKGFVIDASRNGLGPTADYQWCNPPDRALGRKPTTTATGNPLVHAYLWIKPPGESDGSCNGGPSAGSWMPEYALGLAQRAAY